MPLLKLQVFFEKQDKKIKEEEKKDISLKSPERRISENEVKEQILIKPPGKEVSKKENAGEHSKMRDSSQNEDLNRTSPLSQKEKENLVKKVEGCSTRATQKLLSEVDPSLSPLKKEKVRFLGKGKVEVKIVIDEKCHKELEKLKNLLSHRNPNLSYGELISLLSKEALKKHDPGEKNIRQRKEERVQKKPSIKKPEFKSESVELAVTSAPKLRQKDEISEHLETSSSGKSVISAKKQISPTRKLLTSTNKSDGLATSAPRSEQIDQYSKEKIRAKRMAESAAHLVDEVLPYKPLRQWVLSFPFPLRLLFAKDPQLTGSVLNLVLRAISTYLIKKAGFKKKSGPKTGSVTFVQRFGGSLNLNIHFHILYMDGVWTFKQEKTHFHSLSPPSQSELDNLLKTISQRTVKLLEKRGLILRDEGTEHKFLNLKDTQAIDPILTSSITYRIALGKYRGQKALTLRTAPTFSKPKPFLAEYSGFSLHAGVFCPAHNRKKLEHLCRYISRPSLSEARLSLNNKGQVIYKLKTPYRNGTTHIVLDPLDFLSRLASLIPRPRIHLIRFHGVFAPNCKYRSLVVPQSVLLEKTSHKEQKKSYSMGWAKMLRRVFDIDVQTCQKCGGKIKIISAILSGQVIKRILSHLGENTKVPELAPSRGPPEEEEGLVSI